jgi:CLIP-associating protein 1/2
MFENACIEQLIGRLPSVELMAKLPSFLVVLFDAFDNRNAEVQKMVVFCLVGIYIMLGKPFVPYLGSLSSTQLRLLTINANCISQARTGMSLETPQI